MDSLILLLATFVLLIGSTVLVATVGRRRRWRSRAIELRSMQAIEGVIGTALAELVADAIRLRRQIEDAAASSGEMLAIELQLGTAATLRRPLWRQIEDANFGHQLDHIRREASAWLRRFDGLDAADRQIVDLLDLTVEPVRALREGERLDWHENFDRGDELASVQQKLSAAIECLRRVERELVDYRPGGYR